jgi:L-amino acid N-acyltransferase YncA
VRERAGMDGILINDMSPDDWDDVRDIYEEGLATGEASFEVQAPSWPEWDERHHRHSRLVARAAGRVVGWAALSPMSHRACYAGVAEFSLYITAGWRGRGVGKQLLSALIESSEQNGIWTLYASTFPENETSLRLQLACGFRVVGRRERIAKHRGIWRDTILTERRSKVTGTG